MAAYTSINLSALPVPAVLEAISFEDVVAQIKADVIAVMPEIAPVLALETEPAVKVIEVCAAYIMLTRARVNDAARAVLLAYAVGADLEHLAALYGVSRLVLDPGDPLAVPPVAATYETDDDLRFRTQLAPEGFSVAGPRGAYIFHARSASGQVKDVAVESPVPGDVLVTVLSFEGNGTPSTPVLDAVNMHLNAEDIRPLCDAVTVQSAAIVNYSVTATLAFFDGPDPAVVLLAAQTALQAYVTASHKIGRPIRRSAIFAALHQPGVSVVTLTSPAADIVPTSVQAPYCTAIGVTAVP